MKVLICDDSSIARKSIARCIASTPDLKLFFAENGLEALSIMKVQDIDILFLDLTMPIMDGFDVLASMPVNNHLTKTVVISGDIQVESRKRCLALGAMAFIGKPFTQDAVEAIFNRLGLVFSSHVKKSKTEENGETSISKDELLDRFKELANVALGRGAAVISEHLNELIQLPIPNVGYLSYGELKMTIQDVIYREGAVAVSQRFVSGGIYGETLVCLRGEDLTRVGEVLGLFREHCTYNEVVLHISNLLVSSFLVSLGDQLGNEFSLRQPSIVELLNETTTGIADSESFFTIEYLYFAEKMDFECDVLFLLDKSSMDVIYQAMELI